MFVYASMGTRLGGGKQTVRIEAGEFRNNLVEKSTYGD